VRERGRGCRVSCGTAGPNADAGALGCARLGKKKNGTLSLAVVTRVLPCACGARH